MEEFLRYVISQLVEFPDEVIITRTEESDKICLRVAMRKSDYGKIIGKGGHTIQAMRTLVRAAGDKKGVKVSLQVVE